jgi:hypothetical protein
MFNPAHHQKDQRGPDMESTPATRALRLSLMGSAIAVLSACGGNLDPLARPPAPVSPAVVPAWHEPVALENGTGYSKSPKVVVGAQPVEIALDAQGDVMALWVRHSAGGEWGAKLAVLENLSGVHRQPHLS